jgi:transposase, IS30 family
VEPTFATNYGPTGASSGDHTHGTNENTNRLLREYFPKGTDITDDQNYLDLVARELNNRPRRTLGYRTPAEVFTDLLASEIASTS